MAKQRRRRPFRLPWPLFFVSIVTVTTMPLWIMLSPQQPDDVIGEVPATKRHQVLPLDTVIPHSRFQFLQYHDSLHSFNSDIVELRHCNLRLMDWNDYFTWASRILDEKMPQFQKHNDYSNFTDWPDLEQEFVLELLEIYATFSGLCRFDTGYPFVPPMLPDARRLFQNAVPTSPDFAQLAIVIIAFQDALHLQRLIQAIHLPHHYIVIHVERRAPRDFCQQVLEMCSRYNNVKMVQFGTIIYRTDLVTTIQLQLLKWLSSCLTFDHYVALNGAAYPMYSATELGRHLHSSSRHVWLGELTNGKDGTRVRSSQSGMLTGAKRLAFTRGNATKATFRISASLIKSLQMNVSTDIERSMSYKTVSGNQGVYSYDTVKRLLSSPTAMQLFAHAKYACCGVLEERTWIAAMFLIGVGQEALDEPGAVWQVWGGSKSLTCESSVNNAILTTNSSTCFKVEDATRGMVRMDGTAFYIHGDRILPFLKDAKKRGFLFARKFQSNNKESMDLLETIRNEIHN